MIDHSLETIVHHISDSLPQLAKHIISTSYPSQKQYQRFLEKPDDPREHTTRWHQWGIVTHIRKFEEYYREEVPGLLKQWGMYEEVERRLREKIDGTTKGELLRIAILFHDIGKFATRTTRNRRDGTVVNNFIHHEVASGKLIRSGEINTLLTEYGFTLKQKEYIARCAELHFVLGEVRNNVKMSKSGYTSSYATSTKAHSTYEDIARTYPDFCLEIGLLFLADSLSKTEMRVDALSEHTIRKQLEERKIDLVLLNAVKQVPTNIIVAKEYLKGCLRNQT